MSSVINGTLPGTDVSFSGLLNRSGLFLDQEDEAQATLNALAANGYTIKDCEEEWLGHIAAGHLKTPRWFVTLEDITVAQCPHCHEFIDFPGCRSKQHVCPSCHQPTGGRCAIFKRWNGEYYREYQGLPVRESFCIYATWHFPLKSLPAKLESHPRLHETIMSAVSQTARQDFYYQDGRSAFNRDTIEDMRLWAERYTPIDASPQTWKKFRADGPGFIEDLAAVCHPSAVIRNEPNFFNTANALVDAANGKQLSEREIRSAVDGAKKWPWQSN